MKYKVEATKEFESIVDNEVNRTRKDKEQWEVSKERLDELQNFMEENNSTIIKVIEIVEPIVEKATIKKNNVKKRDI